MAKLNNHILLVAYGFPPYPGIGGRRWAKFAKYLAKSGYTVHVICAQNPFDSTSVWLQDVVNHPKIICYPIKGKYPLAFHKPGTLSFLEKLQYKLASVLLPFLTKGTIYDKAIFWRSGLLKSARAIIQKNSIGTVIVTGAPFRSMYDTLSLKAEYPDVKFIADFRDPWTEGKSYGFSDLSSERKAYEIALEKDVCKKADVVTAPSQEILDYLKRNCNNAGNYQLLPHAYDEDEFSALSTNPELKQHKGARILFSGTMYEGTTLYFETVLKALKELKHDDPTMFADTELHLFSIVPPALGSVFNHYELGNTLKLNKPVPPAQLFAEMAVSDYLLVIFAEKYKDYVSTKFYEMLRLNKYIIYLGPAGKVSEFITSNGLGVAVTQIEQIKSVLMELLREKRKAQQFEHIEQFSYEELTKKLIQLLG